MSRKSYNFFDNMEKKIKQYIDIFRALGDKNRLRILLIIKG